MVKQLRTLQVIDVNTCMWSNNYAPCKLSTSTSACGQAKLIVSAVCFSADTFKNKVNKVKVMKKLSIVRLVPIRHHIKTVYLTNHVMKMQITVNIYIVFIIMNYTTRIILIKSTKNLHRHLMLKLINITNQNYCKANYFIRCVWVPKGFFNLQYHY